MHEVSKDEASHWRTDTAKLHIPNKYTFPNMQWPIGEDWNRLELLHQYVLELSYADGGSAAKETWRKSMRMIHAVQGIKALTPVHEKVRMLHEMDSLVVLARTNLTSIVIPSTRFLDSVDATRSISIDELREVIRPSRHHFEDMMSNPLQFESDHPAMTIDELIDLYESFYLLEPIEEKWGRWGSLRCMCKDFMSAALCRHSLLLAMLYDVILKFPAKHYTKKLKLHGKQTRLPNAWAPEDEDEEEEAEVASKLHWCPVTACDDMELGPMPKAKVVMLYLFWLLVLAHIVRFALDNQAVSGGRGVD